MDPDSSNRRVRPWGSELATILEPIMLPAPPGRFSMMTDWPSATPFKRENWKPEAQTVPSWVRFSAFL